MKEEEVEKELINEKYPKAITIEGTKKILEQMEKCICKIYKDGGNKGTGFFCKINYNNKDLPILMTNYHVIDDKYIKENKKITITINDDKECKIIELKDRIIYTDEKKDVTIIEIKKKDKINNYMDVDKRYLNNSIDIIYDKSIYIIQYPLGEKAAVSYGVIDKFNEYNIEFYCNTEQGSSGSPIINIQNNEIIGIHKEGLKKRRINRGTLLKYPINDFINTKLKDNIEKENGHENKIEIYEEESNNIKLYEKEVDDNIDEDIIKERKDYIEEDINSENNIIEINNKVEEEKSENINENKIENNIKEGISSKEINEIEIKINVEEEEINKDIYFLDNTDYIDENNIKHYHDNLKELNELNTELYIYDKKYEFKKYFRPENQGEYKIKLKFNDIKDCSFMFAGCENIININFINFNSENVKDMKYMFSGCINLKNLDLSTFITDNVTNMEGMFGEYNNTSNLDLDSLSLIKNEEELKDFYSKIKVYFKGCNSLKRLKFPSTFNTQNVTNMSYMFCGCNKLEKLDLCTFNTENVLNMMCMFKKCKNVKKIKFSSFNTQKVANMMSMFDGCNKLENLNLPASFNTKNVTNMMYMFYDCYKLKNVELSSFNTENVINMVGMFMNCNELNILKLPTSFKTDNVKNMMLMFASIINLKLLILPSSFNTKNVTNMYGMFRNCNKLENLNLPSSFDTQNVTNMYGMFRNCIYLKNLKLPSLFNNKKVINMDSMFHGCKYFDTFNLNSFKVSDKSALLKSPF